MWFLLVPSAQPAYLTHWLPGLVLAGASIGIVLPSLSAAAVMAHWQQAAGAASPDEPVLSGSARLVLDLLRAHGASFFADLQRDARLLGAQVEQGLAELVAHGLITCDSFAGLRTLVMPADKRNKLRRKHRDPIDDAGR